jgi:hypothetical protein
MARSALSRARQLIVALLAGMLHGAIAQNTTEACTPELQRASLLVMYQNQGGAGWVNNQGWPQVPPGNQTVEDFLSQWQDVPVQSGSCRFRLSRAPNSQTDGLLSTMASIYPGLDLELQGPELPDHCCWAGVLCCPYNATCDACDENCLPCTHGRVLSLIMPSNNVRARDRASATAMHGLSHTLTRAHASPTLPSHR